MKTDEYWERFTHSGNISDYLEYRGMETCSQAWKHNDEEQSRQKEQQTGDGIDESISDGDWYGVIRNSYRGIR